MAILYPVRAHTRKNGAVLVRPHLRERLSEPIGLRLFRPRTNRRDRKMAQDLFLQGNAPRLTSATVDQENEPRTILLTHPSGDPRDLARVISHETMHIAVAEAGGHKASLRLDTRRAPKTYRYDLPARKRLTREGLYRKGSGRGR